MRLAYRFFSPTSRLLRNRITFFISILSRYLNFHYDFKTMPVIVCMRTEETPIIKQHGNRKQDSRALSRIFSISLNSQNICVTESNDDGAVLLTIAINNCYNWSPRPQTISSANISSPSLVDSSQMRFTINVDSTIVFLEM